MARRAPSSSVGSTLVFAWLWLVTMGWMCLCDGCSGLCHYMQASGPAFIAELSSFQLCLISAPTFCGLLQPYLRGEHFTGVTVRVCVRERRKKEIKRMRKQPIILEAGVSRRPGWCYSVTTPSHRLQVIHRGYSRFLGECPQFCCLDMGRDWPWRLIHN